MNRISYKEMKNLNNHKLAICKAPKVNKAQKQIEINNYNIIELKEEEEINLESEQDINIFSEREILRLKKKASTIEEYYLNKGEDANINENCSICLMNNFKPNELLYFAKRKDLLSYLKYCFYFLKKILFLDNQIYIKNRFDLDKCDTNYPNGWKFFIPKTVCRGCFLQIINMEHLFGNLKTIFTDIDSQTTSRSVHRSRSRFNSRSRYSHSMKKNSVQRNYEIKENRVEEKNKNIHGKENKIKIKYNKYNIKNDNISYDDKNGLISIKKDILGEFGNLICKKEENGKKVKNHNKKDIIGLNNELNIHNDEQTVTEIKIKTNEFTSEGISYEKEDKTDKNNKENKSKEFILKEDNKANKNNQNNRSGNINSNYNTNINNLNNEIFIHGTKNNNENEVKDEKQKNSINKIKKTNIFTEVMNIKSMKNEIVLKLYYKLKVFKDILMYTIMNIGDFKEKLINTMHINPNLIAYGINQYIQYFVSLFNEGFKAKKEYEEMFSIIKKDSIPSIFSNINKIKEQDNIKDDDKKNLEEMEKSLKDFEKNIDEIEKKYEEKISNFFANFMYFFNLIKEIQNAFSNQIY